MGENPGNRIVHNHIHDLGQGVLSDLGGIYTNSISPGTRIRYNVVHDVRHRDYGGWGIYNDQGSADILVEKNLVYRCSSGPFFAAPPAISRWRATSSPSAKGTRSSARA